MGGGGGGGGVEKGGVVCVSVASKVQEELLHTLMVSNLKVFFCKKYTCL